MVHSNTDMNSVNLNVNISCSTSICDLLVVLVTLVIIFFIIIILLTIVVSWYIIYVYVYKVKPSSEKETHTAAPDLIAEQAKDEEIISSSTEETFQRPSCRTGPSHQGNPETKAPATFQQPRTGPSHKGNAKFQQPRTGPSHKGNAKFQQPRTGPSHQGTAKFQQPRTGPSHQGTGSTETKVSTSFQQPRTGPNHQCNTEKTKAPTAGFQYDAVSRALVATTKNSGDLSSDEDNPSSDEDNPALNGAQVTPLIRSPGSRSYRRSQRIIGDFIRAAELLYNLQQRQLRLNNFTSQLFQQWQPNDSLRDLFPYQNCDVMETVRPIYTGDQSIVATGHDRPQRRSAAALEGLCSILKPCFNIIAEMMPADWQRLATNLDLSFAQIRAVKSEQSSDCWMCCTQVLDMWRSINGTRATVEVLIQAVRETGHQDVAERLEAMQLD